MELELVRTYWPAGTNGDLSLRGVRICSTIELPWLNNRPQMSCIPEGKYELTKRYSRKYGWHLQVNNVKNRDLILIHPANDAARELKGCIAPVSVLTAPGRGLQSRKALEKLQTIVYPVLDLKKKVLLIVANQKTK